jgi:hypothetical protein
MPTFWPSAAEMEFTTLQGQGWLFVSADGGETWDVRALPKPYGVVTFLDSSVGWFAGSDEYYFQLNGETSLYLTRDGANTWTLLTKLTSVAQLDCIDELTCWAVTLPSWMAEEPRDVAILMKTTDGGTSWTEIQPRVSP